MECDICGRHASSRRPVNCATCARLDLYKLRLDLAKTLLEKEDAGRRVEAVVKNDIPSNIPNTVLDGVIVDAKDCARSSRYTALKAETALTRDRMESINQKAELLRKQLTDYKKTIADLKSSVAQKKSDAESAAFGLESRSASEIESVQKATRRINRGWDQEQQAVIHWRKTLCREAAKLAGLKKLKVVESQRMKEYYEIGHHLRVIDLRDLAKVEPELLTASLTQIAFLVARVATYLAVQLPAEIVLPHNNEPLPTIYQPNSSYANRKPSAARSSSYSSLNPTTAKQPEPRIPRPRPLAVQKGLSKLIKDDSISLSYFVEGATLLAWNIAWLCRTQGMQGLEDWKDVCNMGRNLWQLLMADHRSARSLSKKRDDIKDYSSTDESQKNAGNIPQTFGQFSHGTSHSFLGSYEGSAMVRKWKFYSPAKVVDDVKRHLVSEMQGAEWEVLQEMEWSGAHEEQDEEPVIVRAKRPSHSNSGNKSDGTHKPGTSGWTKLRSRNASSEAKTGNTTGNDTP